MNTQTDNRPRCALADGSALGTLPEEWVCEQCGSEAWAFAVIRLWSEMEGDERRTLECYGASKSQFLDSEEIELCGSCHGSHWRAPNK